MIYKISTILLVVLALISYVKAESAQILVFSKTEKFRHKSIPAAQDALKKIGAKNAWKLDFSEDANVFDDFKNIKKYRAIVFLMTTGDILNETQEKVFQNYIESGGGFVGVHSATDTEYDWKFYGKIIGTYFEKHPKIQPVKIKLADKNFPATEFLPAVWERTDELYNFKNAPPRNVNVLLELDETSYKGGTMGERHPIAWYHNNEGGRVFYTGLGHTDESYNEPLFLRHLENGIAWASGQKEMPSSAKWTNLLDRDLKFWDVFMGVPDKSLTIEGLAQNDAGEYREPLGYWNDPKRVFTVENENGKPVLHVSGEIYGSITSKRIYKNYHFSLEMKWGEKKFAPRLERPRDSGILYHAVGRNGAFWNVWKRSLECQIQEQDIGDFYSLAGAMTDIRALRKPFETDKLRWMWTSDAENLVSFGVPGKGNPGYCRRSENAEKPHGQWNLVEVIAFGDRSIHIVNGKVVNVLQNNRQEIDGEIVPLTEGQIQIQSEGAEVFYRDLKIRSISEMPKEYQKFFR